MCSADGRARPSGAGEADRDRGMDGLHGRRVYGIGLPLGGFAELRRCRLAGAEGIPLDLAEVRFGALVAVDDRAVAGLGAAFVIGVEPLEVAHAAEDLVLPEELVRVGDLLGD